MMKTYVRVYLRESAGGTGSAVSMIGFTSEEIADNTYVFDEEGEVVGIVPTNNVALTEFVKGP